MKDKIAIWIVTYLLIFVSLWASFSSWSDNKIVKQETDVLKENLGKAFFMINELDKRQSLLGFQIVSIDTTIKHKTYSLKMHQDGHGEWIEEAVQQQ